MVREKKINSAMDSKWSSLDQVHFWSTSKANHCQKSCRLQSSTPLRWIVLCIQIFRMDWSGISFMYISYSLWVHHYYFHYFIFAFKVICSFKYDNNHSFFPLNCCAICFSDYMRSCTNPISMDSIIIIWLLYIGLCAQTSLFAQTHHLHLSIIFLSHSPSSSNTLFHWYFLCYHTC